MEDFGFKFNQQQSPKAAIDYNLNNNIHSMKYVRPTEAFLDIAGLPSNPTYDQIMARLSSKVASGDPEALSIINSGVKDKNGRYLYWTGSPWVPTYARFMVNPSPSVVARPNNYEMQWVDDRIQVYMNGWGMDGVMVDNTEFFYWYATQDRTRLNFNKDHFPIMQTPLIHDNNGNVGIGYEMMIWEYLKAVRTDLVNREIMIPVIGNGVPYNTNFLASQLDLIGGEQSWQKSDGWLPAPVKRMIRFRMNAGKKPVVFLQNPYDLSSWTKEMSEKYFARSCAFGILPSFFMDGGGNSGAGVRYFDNPSYYERDRELFKKYIPIIKTLSQAGWEPIPNAEVSDKEIVIERFNDEINDAEYITLFNPTSQSKSFKVISSYYANKIEECKNVFENSNLNWIDNSISLTLASESVSVIKLKLNQEFLSTPINFRIVSNN